MNLFIILMLALLAGISEQDEIRARELYQHAFAPGSNGAPLDQARISGLSQEERSLVIIYLHASLHRMRVQGSSEFSVEASFETTLLARLDDDWGVQAFVRD